MNYIPSTEFIEVLKQHFAQGGRVMVASYTRPTVYDSRHVSMFRPDADGRGIRIGWPGKRSVYCFQCSLVFSKLSTQQEGR